MEEKGFCLKWEKFLEVCKGMFSQLLKNEQFTDVTLFCEGRLIRCHRLVLSASSQYFQRLLVELNQPNPVIAMQNIKLQDLLAIITFVYTGEVTVAQEQLASLVKLGEMLKVKGLGENDEEDMPPVQHNVKKNVSVSNFEKSDSEIGLVKRRRLESDIGNGLTQFEQCQELLRVEQNDDTAQLYAHSILVKEESSTLDLEPESNESLVHDDKDMDFTTYEDQDLAGPSADFKDTSFHDSGDPGEGSSFANNSQDSQIEDKSSFSMLSLPSAKPVAEEKKLGNVAVEITETVKVAFEHEEKYHRYVLSMCKFKGAEQLCFGGKVDVRHLRRIQEALETILHYIEDSGMGHLLDQRR